MSRDASGSSRQDSRKIVLLEVAYRLNVSRVYTLCLRLLANVRAAEEATVDVFARFSRELTRRWDESLVRKRLRELAIDEALQRLWRSQERLGRRAAAVGTPPAASIPAAKAIARAESRLLDSVSMNELIARLPDELRVAFVLHDIEEVNDGDTARYLRVRETEAGLLISRARLELRQLWLTTS